MNLYGICLNCYNDHQCCVDPVECFCKLISLIVPPLSMMHNLPEYCKIIVEEIKSWDCETRPNYRVFFFYSFYYTSCFMWDDINIWVGSDFYLFHVSLWLFDEWLEIFSWTLLFFRCVRLWVNQSVKASADHISFAFLLQQPNVRGPWSSCVRTESASIAPKCATQSRTARTDQMSLRKSAVRDL